MGDNLLADGRKGDPQLYVEGKNVLTNNKLQLIGGLGCWDEWDVAWLLVLIALRGLRRPHEM